MSLTQAVRFWAKTNANAKTKCKMKRNALAQVVKIFDFGIPLVGNCVEQVWNFVFYHWIRLKSQGFFL